jgi:hypothetical protein
MAIVAEGEQKAAIEGATDSELDAALALELLSS